MASLLLLQKCPVKTHEEVLTMKHPRRIVITAMSCLALVAAAWAGPQDTPQSRPEPTKQQSSAQPPSVSGKITSVEKDSFTLTLVSQTSSPGQGLSQQSAKTMTFLIDKNTAVDGTLKVDSNAEVTYRQDSGANIAISVRVTP
jgi:hypothetical protein